MATLRHEPPDQAVPIGRHGGRAVHSPAISSRFQRWGCAPRRSLPLPTGRRVRRVRRSPPRACAGWRAV